MAFVDVSTGQIIGAKEGSLVWWHEKGHIVYNESEHGIKNDYTRQSLFHFTILFIIISLFYPIFKWLAFSSYVGYVGYGIYEEAWCWKYAFLMRREEQNN